MDTKFCLQECGKWYKSNNPEKCYENETCNIQLGCGNPYYIPDENDEWDEFVDAQIDILAFIYSKFNPKPNDWLFIRFWLQPEQRIMPELSACSLGVDMTPPGTEHRN